MMGLLMGSRAQLDGRRVVEGMMGEVRVERDELGVPRIRGATRLEVGRALGFVHGQERFFQMDLLRRSGSGRLAALFGSVLLKEDMAVRRHGLGVMARESVERLSVEERQVLEAYTEGVNAGLSALRSRPPEYWLLGRTPEPWRPEDSILVGVAMAFRLQDSTGREDLMRELLLRQWPEEVVSFYYPLASSWDAALDGSRLVSPSVPGPEVMDWRQVEMPDGGPEGGVGPLREGPMPGSNSWGVEGTVSATGSAMVANDMHLDLGIPNVWYRVEMRWQEGEEERFVVGVTLPGVPAVIVGSNGYVAWSFTNATLDTGDVIRLEMDPERPQFYRTPDGWRELEVVRERIEVRDARDQEVTFERTLWGPVVEGRGVDGRWALAWVGHRPGAINFRLLDLERARSVDEALAVAPLIAVPVQNLLVGDREGNLAWTLIGRLPNRVGMTGDRPVSWAQEGVGWEGWLPAERYPQWRAKPGERLWTANHRMLGTKEYLELGPYDADLGARAGQIRDRLEVLERPVNEGRLWEIFGDDEARFLVRWQALLLATLRVSGEEVIREVVKGWGSRADVDSAGYRVVRTFRRRVMERVLEPMWQQSRAGGATLELGWTRHEEPVWALLEARAGHGLNPRFESYEALLRDALEAAVKELTPGGRSLRAATWGMRNQVRVQHPFSLAMPMLEGWLDMPVTPLSGDDHMPRVQGVGFGASQRLVVSPGFEDRGLFHMPGGQSGHFLSPFYRRGHEAWVEMKPEGLRPGPVRYRLILAGEGE
jgi:penicillin amidase